MNARYEEFVARIRDINTLVSTREVLEWDLQTMMPRKGGRHRAAQMALLAGVAHERLVSDSLGQLLQEVERNGELSDPIRAANVRETRRIRERAIKLPQALVERMANVTAMAFEAWQAARSDSQFGQFAPHLAEIVQIAREIAERIGYKNEPYDALLDEYEPGAETAPVEAVFERLRPELVRLSAELRAAPRQPDLSALERPAPAAAQEQFARRLAVAMGYDFEAGRLDVATHPFCSGFHPQDVRITTRYDERNLAKALFGVMHETGHALYEQGLPLEHAGTPAGDAVSLGIHESQSRMWENFVGRSRPFWSHFYPQMQRSFTAWGDVPLEAWHFAINAVRPSFIRVEADEVTYGLHIMLRFDLERRLITGRLAVTDVPEAWNEGMRATLGIVPPNDAQGCLQDIHWSAGMIGYFPTYQLGNMYAAQFYAAARRHLPALDEHLARGELRPLLEWLRENVHRHGQRYRAAELVQVVTGRPLTHEPLVEYLRAKYTPLYGLAEHQA